jgi:hypothetical protein
VERALRLNLEKSLHIEARRLHVNSVAKSGTVFLFFATVKSSKTGIQNIVKAIKIKTRNEDSGVKFCFSPGPSR